MLESSTQKPRFVINKVREAPEGFEKAIALVSFTFTPAEGESVKVTRYSKANKKSYDAGAIFGASFSIRLDDVPVNEGTRGPWLALGSIEIPRDACDAIAQAAIDKLESTDTAGPGDTFEQGRSAAAGSTHTRR